MNLYWAACRLDIPATSKSLLRHISLSFNEEHDRPCHFGLDKLAAHTGLNKTTVIRSTKWLEQMGLLVVDRGGGRGSENLYFPVPRPNSKVKAIGERVAERNGFNASAAEEAVALCRETVARRSESVSPCIETVAPCNPKGFKEKKEKEKPVAEGGTRENSGSVEEFYERPEYRASFSEKDAGFVVMYHRHGKEKLAKFYGIENTERIATLIAEAQAQKRFAMEKNGDTPAIAPLEAAPLAPASEEAKAEADRIVEAKAMCPMFTRPDGKVIPLTMAGYLRRPQNTAVEFRELLIVGGITPEKAEARLREVAAAHGELGAAQFMRQFIDRHGAAIRNERRVARTSGAIASAVRWIKPAQVAA